jgi:UDP:flavonoid glycosyltransferase YjiC (YdhE family)
MDVRVLVSAVPEHSHIVPLLDLARAVQLAGHEVRFATNLERHSLIAAAGLQPCKSGFEFGPDAR